MLPEGGQESVSQSRGGDPMPSPQRSLVGKEKCWQIVSRAFSRLCGAPLEVSASILLSYLWLFFSCQGVSLVQGQHLLKESSLGMKAGIRDTLGCYQTGKESGMSESTNYFPSHLHTSPHLHIDCRGKGDSYWISVVAFWRQDERQL